MKKNINKILTILIALVWLINGFFAKVLGYVPRHEQIVARILGEDYSTIIIKAIGVGEIFIAIWIMSRIFTRFNAIVQIILVVTMNIMEFIIAKDLLLWGKLNAFFALIFVFIVFYNEFILGKETVTN